MNDTPANFKAAPLHASEKKTLAELDALVTTCAACPRLVAWREEVAATKRAAFQNETYWGRPVPGFGPAAHGGNRTGRMFTGDQSGDVLFAALHRTGFANQDTSVSIDDGLELTDLRMSAPVKCAPPQNKPDASERHNCSPFLAREIELLADTLRVVFVLGGFGWNALLSVLKDGGWEVPSPRPKFGHGKTLRLQHPDGRSLAVHGCYHVSQHNTFTGRLTPEMLDAELMKARELAEL